MKFSLMQRFRSLKSQKSLVATVSNFVFSTDPVRYRKICAVPCGKVAHISRPRNGPANL
jgi:hypothetical protein